MEQVRITIGDATLTRVPYADVLVDASVIQLTPEQIKSVPWAEPLWAEGGKARVAAAAWVIESDGRRIVVDPAQAADGILRGDDAGAHQTAFAAALEQSGFPRDTVDTVIASHIDGIGMIAWRDGDDWSPFFPNARVLLSQRELDAIAAHDTYQPQGADALLALHEQGVVDAVDDGHAVTPDVMLQWTGAHSPGHQVVRITSPGRRAAMVGHLALSPLHCIVGDSPLLHFDAPAAIERLHQLRDTHDVLIGPLWPAPGAATWDGTSMQPVA